MRRFLVLGFFISLLLAVSSPARANPDLRSGRPAGALTVYSDDRRADLYYYPPGELTLATGADGRPDLHFLQMRYTGTAAGADRGVVVFRSILSFRVVMSGPTPAAVRVARDALIAAGAGRNLELRPLPIQRLEAVLVYAPVGAEGTGEEEQALPRGHFESAEGASGATANAYWSERIYTLALDPAGSQLFWDSLQQGRLVLSVGYAFFAFGIPPAAPLAELIGTPKLLAELRDAIASPSAGAGASATEPPPSTLVRAGATGIAVDARAWPDLFRRIDVNETVPPGYAALDVYCYDFNNALRPDLYEKQVEIDAEGMGRRRIALTTTFRRESPDLYAASLRFRLAVRMDRPYRFRVIELKDDGTTIELPWRERASWAEILDVTSPPEARPTPRAPADETEDPE